MLSGKLPRRRRLPLPIEDGRPESAFIAEKSFEEEDIGVDLGGGDEPSTEVATSGGAGRTKRWGGRDAASSSKPMWRVSYEWRDLGAKLGGSDPRGLVEETVGGGVEEASARYLALSCRQRLKERESRARTTSGTTVPRSGDQRVRKFHTTDDDEDDSFRVVRMLTLGIFRPPCKKLFDSIRIRCILRH